MTKVGYRMTEIGEIPEEWSLDILENEVEIMDSRRVPLSEVEREQRKGPFPYCGANGIIDYVDDYIFDEEAILLAEDGGSYGKFQNSAYLMDGKYWVNNHAHIIKGKRGIVNNKYILYWLNYSDINKYISGSTRAKLNQERLKSIPIPRVPLPEQQKIAEILTTADDEIQKVNEQITLTEQLKNGLMQRLLTIGIGHTRFKMTEIGEIPEEWDIRELKEFAKVEYGKSNPRTDGKIPLVGSSGVFGRVAKALIESPTIVIGRKGTAGAVWDIESPSWPSDTSFYLIYKNYGIVQKYLYSFMSLNKLSGDKAKTTLPSLQKTELEKFIVPLPPFPEQQKIAEILSTVDNKLELLRRKKEKLDVLKKGLMNDLLTGKVRVKV